MNVSANVAVKSEDWRRRDELVESQPALWAQSMLEQAEQAKMPDARDAILARIGLVLFSRFGVAGDVRVMRGAADLWAESDDGYARG